MSQPQKLKCANPQCQKDLETQNELLENDNLIFYVNTHGAFCSEDCVLPEKRMKEVPKNVMSFSSE